MTIDKESKLTARLYLKESNLKEVLKNGLEGANASGLNYSEDKNEHMYAIDEILMADEIYLEGNTLNFNIIGDKFELWLEYTLSDKVLIDILGLGVKKLNKLKVALESLN